MLKVKKIAILVLSFFMFCTTAVADSVNDYSYLDGMTLEQLNALKTEVESRISQAKAVVEQNDTDDLGVWELRYYVDEFNLPTSDGYLTNSLYVKGTFSNSATTNSKLNVVWLIDKNDVAFKLYEYGHNLVKSSFDTTYYSILMLDPDGNRVYMSGKMYEGSDRIFVDDEYESVVLDALKKNGSVTFRVEETGKYASSSYLFTMEDTSYFTNAYKKLLNQ